MQRHSKLHSVFFNKCPRCGEGDFFISKSAYSLKNFDKMNRNCPHCGESLVPEPGFYQGALYMSYAFYVAFMLVYFFAFTYFLPQYLDYFLVSIIPVLILLTPYFYRLARRSWLAIFIKPIQTEV
jgi:ribosomal protein S27AE